jgi:hypothetical protein
LTPLPEPATNNADESAGPKLQLVCAELESFSAVDVPSVMRTHFVVASVLTPSVSEAPCFAYTVPPDVYVPEPPLNDADVTEAPKLDAATSAIAITRPSGSEAFAQRERLWTRLVAFPFPCAGEFSSFCISQTPFALGSSLAQPQSCEQRAAHPLAEPSSLRRFAAVLKP